MIFLILYLLSVSVIKNPIKIPRGASLALVHVEYLQNAIRRAGEICAQDLIALCEMLWWFELSFCVFDS